MTSQSTAPTQIEPETLGSIPAHNQARPVPTSPDHRNARARARSQAEQTAADIALG